jgi:type VI secretion system protein ImpH
MASPGGAESSALIHQDERYAAVETALWSEPWSFQFFQAVRLLERMFGDRSPVGRFVHPAKEVIRFEVNSSTAFPASQIQDIRWAGSATPIMAVNFMGLTGPLGVLPLYYSELIRERLRAKDPTLLAFLNLFNHRMISLFYHAWEKYRFTVAYERGERDRLSHHLLDLIGLGTKGLQERQSVRDDSLLFYAGMFAMHTRSAATLRNIVEDYFDVPVRVEQFVGAWHALSTADQCRFEFGNTLSEQLAAGAVVGDEIWDQQSNVRITLGPLSLDEYVDFLPEGTAYAPLIAITRFFAGDEIDFEVQLVLRRDEVPPCELDDTPGERVLPQLGWSTWVKTSPMRRDPGDTILRI